jgi:hypothetical protein
MRREPRRAGERRSPDDADQRAARSDSGAADTERRCADGEPSIGGADAKRSISIPIPWTPSVARRRKGVVHRRLSAALG